VRAVIDFPRFCRSRLAAPGISSARHCLLDRITGWLFHHKAQESSSCRILVPNSELDQSPCAPRRAEVLTVAAGRQLLAFQALHSYKVSLDAAAFAPLAGPRIDKEHGHSQLEEDRVTGGELASTSRSASRWWLARRVKLPGKPLRAAFYVM
jgi:hypothetical protein